MQVILDRCYTLRYNLLFQKIQFYFHKDQFYFHKDQINLLKGIERAFFQFPEDEQ